MNYEILQFLPNLDYILQLIKFRLKLNPFDFLKILPDEKQDIFIIIPP